MEKDRLDDLGGVGSLVTIWIFKKRDGWHGLCWSGSRQGQVAGSWNSGKNLSE